MFVRHEMYGLSATGQWVPLFARARFEIKCCVFISSADFITQMIGKSHAPVDHERENLLVDFGPSVVFHAPSRGVVVVHDGGRKEGRKERFKVEFKGVNFSFVKACSLLATNRICDLPQFKGSKSQR